jgi:RNA polymerase sigma factor (sigma-70 family)
MTGKAFRDLNKNGIQDPYEDKSRPKGVRVADLLSKMTLEEKAGLMFHFMIGMSPDAPCIRIGGCIFSPVIAERAGMVYGREMDASIASGHVRDQLSEWIRAYGNLVLSVCMKVLRNPETARDISQDVWILIIQNIESFQNKSKPGTWIYTIAYREALRASKKEKNRRYQDLLRIYHDPKLQPAYREEPGDPEFLTGWLYRECNNCLSGVVKTMKFRMRVLFVFRFILGLPFSEIAEIMNMKEEAVRQASNRSRRRLADFLTNECGIYKKGSACKCGMEKHLARGSFREEMLALQTLTEKAIRLHEAGERLPSMDYWENILKIVTNSDASTSNKA